MIGIDAKGASRYLPEELLAEAERDWREQLVEMDKYGTAYPCDVDHL